MPTLLELGVVTAVVGAGAYIATKVVKKISGKDAPNKTQEQYQNPQLKEMQGVRMRSQLQTDAFMRAAVA